MNHNGEMEDRATDFDSKKDIEEKQKLPAKLLVNANRRQAGSRQEFR